jgi:hypothetical protein
MFYFYIYLAINSALGLVGSNLIAGLFTSSRNGDHWTVIMLWTGHENVMDGQINRRDISYSHLPTTRQGINTHLKMRMVVITACQMHVILHLALIPILR